MVVSSYSNITLKSKDLSVTIYLPESIHNDQEEPFYASSRFEHGSMIGSITRRNNNNDNEESTLLYGTDLWRVPHNPGWTESGVGLASEFGVGDNGAFCNFQCGWYGVSDVSNGVLGYIQAKNGEPFLKIGVGVLEKGSCYECDSSEDYKFNSPYAFAEPPVWTMQHDESANSVTLQHEAVLHAKKFYGYRIKKCMELDAKTNALRVTTTLTNLGQDAFTTAWYSHHFFSCNNDPIGEGYSVDLYTKPNSNKQIFEEPSLWSWSTPLRNYAKVTAVNNNEYVEVEMQREVNDGVRIKAEFPRDDTTDGSFTLRGCGTAITETIPQVVLGGAGGGLPTNGDVSMYAFNLYVERGTLSPEPQLLIHLDPGKTTSWTQVLEFADDDKEEETSTNTLAASLLQAAAQNALLVDSSSGSNNNHHSRWKFRSSTCIALFVACACVSVLYRGGRRNSYTPIPDEPPPPHDEEVA